MMEDEQGGGIAPEEGIVAPGVGVEESTADVMRVLAADQEELLSEVLPGVTQESKGAEQEEGGGREGLQRGGRRIQRGAPSPRTFSVARDTVAEVLNKSMVVSCSKSRFRSPNSRPWSTRLTVSLPFRLMGNFIDNQLDLILL